VPAHVLIAEARGAAPAVAIHSERGSEAAARQVMLAQKYEGKSDPTGWWISEKLDGVRGYWDGKNFYSRLGNQFPAPEWFKVGLPPTPLDGELWCGRRQFRRCLSIVRNRASGELWEYITYLVFDAPDLKEPYEERVAHVKRTVTLACKYAAPVGIVKCEGRSHLQGELRKVDAKGGEGLMLRAPRSPYENKRSRVLQKVKSVHDEEAKVVGHEGGRGAGGFHCGALTLTTPDGRQFSCGSGLSTGDRRDPPAIGTIVTYRFTELMDNGYPRFPVYVGPRIDLDWAAYCASYKPPSKDDHTPGALKKSHTILYSDGPLARSLSVRAEALAVDPLPSVPDGEAAASEGSEGGETEIDSAPGGHGQRLGGRRLVGNRRDAAALAAGTRLARTANGPSSGRARARLWRGASRGLAPEVRAAACTASAGIVRSRSQKLADDTGLDIDIVRGMLAEHDRASTP